MIWNIRVTFSQVAVCIHYFKCGNCRVLAAIFWSYSSCNNLSRGLLFPSSFIVSSASCETLIFLCFAFLGSLIFLSFEIILKGYVKQYTFACIVSIFHVWSSYLKWPIFSIIIYSLIYLVPYLICSVANNVMCFIFIGCPGVFVMKCTFFLFYTIG